MFIRLVIVAAVVFEILWALQLRNGSMPRSPETVQAIHEWQASPSDATKAVMKQQIHRDGARNALHDDFILGLMLVADIIAISFFWNYRVAKPAA